ncbi:MAG: glutamine--fructose-6-phosphate transaminase (isomerizing) [Thermodesulfobacteriota bacterium]|nr:glutamine--fructose-6-phosphate transaminase (isomerizing) [Thermodesulfobacteriota bacterium]
MCGIIGYVGHRRVIPVLLDGLKMLEYRGYDSAGIAYLKDGKINISRAEGKLENLDLKLNGKRDEASFTGIGHTRWATHGVPNERNAHPHTDCKNELVVVHNGIIENYFSLRENLKAEGHEFRSDTDTEVLAHLIEKYFAGDLSEAVARAVREVEGSYALAAMCTQDGVLVAARYQSPLVLGLGEGEYFLASDIPAFLRYTKDVMFLDDGEMVIVRRDGIQIKKAATGEEVKKKAERITWDAAMAEKAGFKHFMLKEIYEQPQAILNTVRGRVSGEEGEAYLPEIDLSEKELKAIRRIMLVACGTSWHAALLAKYYLEKWVGLPTEVDLASEFRYRSLLIDGDTLTVPISQSGETADTLAGLRIAKEKGSKIISICNVVGSTVSRESHGTIYTHAGPEIGVASTKAFTSQLTALYLLTIYLGRVRGVISKEKARLMIKDIIDLPPLLEDNIKNIHAAVKELALEFYKKRDFLYLGRNYMFPIALEGALKLKEISYIHAEGYAAGEMKHGPIALIDEAMPVVALAPASPVYDKVLSNVLEVMARRGIVIALADEGDEKVGGLASHTLFLPKVSEEMAPILYTVPLQLLAYEIAVLRGCDVDQPRNLAKSVTVE